MKRILLISALFLLSCSSTPTPLPTPPPEPLPEDASLCSVAGVNVAKVCPKLWHTPAGKTYTQFCKDKLAQDIPMNPTCVAKAKNCDDIDVCTGSK